MGGMEFLPFDAKKLAAFTGADKADKKGKGKKDGKKDEKAPEKKSADPKHDALEKTL